MNKRTVLIVLLVALIPLLLSQFECAGEGSSIEQDTQQSVEELQRHLVFFRHKTSGLCFATMTDLTLQSGMRGYLAHVPCAEITPHLLKEPTP